MVHFHNKTERIRETILDWKNFVLKALVRIFFMVTKFDRNGWTTESLIALKISFRQYFVHKTAFCLGGQQGMLVNDECSFWYNRVGYFLVLIWDRRKQLLYTDRSACMAQ